MGKRRKWDRKEERKVEGKREEGKSTETEEGKGKGGGRKGGKGRGREGIGGRERQEEEGVNRDTFWMPWELRPRPSLTCARPGNAPPIREFRVVNISSFT